MAWLPGKKVRLLTWIGQNTMPVFVIHGFAVKYLQPKLNWKMYFIEKPILALPALRKSPAQQPGLQIYSVSETAKMIVSGAAVYQTLASSRQMPDQFHLVSALLIKKNEKQLEKSWQQRTRF